MNPLVCFERLVEYGKDIKPAPAQLFQSSELNQWFERSIEYWNALGGTQLFTNGSILDAIRNCRQSLLNIKLLCENCTHFDSSTAEYYTLRIRSFFKFNVPLCKILYLFDYRDVIDFKYETRSKGLCLHDLDSIAFHPDNHSPHDHKAAYLETILKRFYGGASLYPYFPVFKYDEYIEKLSKQNVAILLEESFQLMQRDARFFHPLTRYVTMPNLVNHFEMGQKWVPSDVTGPVPGDKCIILDKLIDLIKSVNVAVSYHPCCSLFHTMLRRIFFDIGSDPSNEQFLIELMNKKPDFVEAAFSIFSRFDDVSAIEIFPFNLLDSEPFLFALFNAVGLANEHCFLPIYFQPGGPAPKNINYNFYGYFSRFYSHIIANDLASPLSRIVYCTAIIYSAPQITLQMFESLGSISQIGRYITPVIHHTKALNLGNVLGKDKQVQLMIDVFNMGLDIDFSAELQRNFFGLIIKIISIFQIDPKIGEQILDTLSSNAAVKKYVKPIVASALEGIKEASRVPNASYWYIPVGIVSFITIIALWILAAKLFQRHPFVHVNQTKPQIVAEFEDQTCEENYFVLVDAEEEQMLRRALKEEPYFKVE